METLTLNKPISWSLRNLWNDSVALEQRELKERDYCWASELYKPTVDRYLAMKAVKPTNPPNLRSLRKFFAGNVWEFVVGLVLHQLGIIQDAQQEVWVTDAPIAVKGKNDYLAGGIPNYSKARDMIASLPFDREMNARFLKVIDNFEQTLGTSELELMVHEIKSCSEYVIDTISEGGRIIGHDLQTYHYCRGLKMPMGRIDYISKNDSLMAEAVVKNPDANLQQIYESDLHLLKKYLDANEQPPPAPLIVWEGKFKKNFGVEYSNYLELVYGFKEPKDYSDAVKGKIASWNRVLARLKMINDGARAKPSKKNPEGKPMELTDKNKLAIEEMQKEGWNPYDLAAKAKIELDEDEEQ